MGLDTINDLEKSKVSLTFYNGGILIRKWPVKEKLDYHRRFLLQRLGVCISMWRGKCQDILLHEMSPSVSSKLSRTTCPSPLLPPSYGWLSLWYNISFQKRSTRWLPSWISRLHRSQRQSLVHHQQFVEYFRNRWTGPKVDIVWEYYHLISSFSVGACPGASSCAKISLNEANFIAWFLYCLPICLPIFVGSSN